jgi:hypothetical protein
LHLALAVTQPTVVAVKEGFSALPPRITPASISACV